MGATGSTCAKSLVRILKYGNGDVFKNKVLDRNTRIKCPRSWQFQTGRDGATQQSDPKNQSSPLDKPLLQIYRDAVQLDNIFQSELVAAHAVDATTNHNRTRQIT
jgi:hypothetical protein